MPYGHTIESMDDYYSNNLLGAVDEAKERPHHYDYSNTYRYKRTTAQSINLNRINLTELEDTHLSMTAQGTDEEEILELRADNDIASRELNPDIKNALLNNTPTINTFLIQNTGVAHSTNGSTSSSGILNHSTMISTPRP